jgi:hypothetical protein
MYTWHLTVCSIYFQQEPLYDDGHKKKEQHPMLKEVTVSLFTWNIHQARYC